MTPGAETGGLKIRVSVVQFHPWYHFDHDYTDKSITDFPALCNPITPKARSGLQGGVITRKRRKSRSRRCADAHGVKYRFRYPVNSQVILNQRIFQSRSTKWR